MEIVDPFPPEHLTEAEAAAALQAMHQRAYELRGYRDRCHDPVRKASLARNLTHLHAAIEKIEGLA